MVVSCQHSPTQSSMRQASIVCCRQLTADDDDLGFNGFFFIIISCQLTAAYYAGLPHETLGEVLTTDHHLSDINEEPTTPNITGPASPVPGENIPLTCSSSSRSLPPDHHPLTMTYIWRRDRTLLESGDGSPTGGDDLTITHVSRENHGDIYSCQTVEEGLKSNWSHGHVLDVLSRGVTESVAVSIVPVATVCSVLIVVIAVVVIVVVCRKQRHGGKGYTHNRVVTYTRDSGTDGSYQEIEEREYADYG
ncbi:uncharacterized protein LOC124292011 [Haliotis rubra]|uniref:uncharacterized protein LOC124292011 n=1 Tax=Haliotis rubra TaxID=36100 RepID=UPI001EE5DBB5|nr:uncharacterized protein LOC124292011 [Haliotis rubra]